ncbi:MAG: AAA family ATPase, partial [Bacteroidia bacterium]|nr:AAA family ATPase [Bacteroidia bacterium]
SGRFLELVIQKRILLHRQIKGMEIGFYDRGIPDSIAYIKFQNKKVPRILSEAIETYRYNQVVFVTPPWEEIFFNDSVRWETFHQAGMLYELATEAYQEAGYSLVELPQSSLELRLELISKYAPLTLR